MNLLAVRRGATRTAVLIGPLAVKVPRARFQRGPRGLMWGLSAGVLANLSEREWSCVEGVNPVLWSFAGVANVYRRLPEVTVPGSVADWNTPEGERWWRLIAPTCPALDCKPENLGMLHGRVVWVDYADGKRHCPACGHCDKLIE